MESDEFPLVKVADGQHTPDGRARFIVKAGYEPVFVQRQDGSFFIEESSTTEKTLRARISKAQIYLEGLCYSLSYSENGGLEGSLYKKAHAVRLILSGKDPDYP